MFCVISIINFLIHVLCILVHVDLGSFVTAGIVLDGQINVCCSPGLAFC